MSPDEFGQAMGFLIVSMSGGLAALWMILRAWSRKKGAGSSEVARLTDAVTDLREEIEILRRSQEDHHGALMEVHERLDFAERLLTTGKKDARIDEEARTRD